MFQTTHRSRVVAKSAMKTTRLSLACTTVSEDGGGADSFDEKGGEGTDSQLFCWPLGGGARAGEYGRGGFLNGVLPLSFDPWILASHASLRTGREEGQSVGVFPTRKAFVYCIKREAP